MKKILFLLLLPVLVFGQSKNQNFVKTKVYKAPSTQTLQSSDTIVNIQYQDGLGREMQNIAYKAGGTGQDIVTPITYDDYSGRQSIQYLPYANPLFAVNSPNYRDNTTLITTQKNYYKAQFPADFAFKSVPSYSQTIAESSPLGRVTGQAAPGDAWAVTSGHTVKIGYDTNTSADQVYDFRVRFINGNTEQPEIYLVYNLRVSTQYYSGSQLYKTTVKNENWKSTDGNNNTTVEFKDKQGRLILNRKYDLGVAHDTYYVYDDYGNLTFVITPQAFADPNAEFISTFSDINGNTFFVIDQSIINNLCYTYKYDSRNRVVEKLTAGKVVASYTNNAEYIVYDKLDRPVFTQNGNQRAANKWLFTKYDKFDRIVYTGECVIAKDRVTLQSEVNSAATLFESKTPAATFSSNGASVYYTRNAYSSIIPTTIELFTVNYYDNYTFTRTGISIPTDFNEYGTPITTALKTLPTGTMKRVLGSTTWMTSVICYDAKGRVVWSKTSQPLYATYTTFQSKLDFMGQPLETKQNHIRSGAVDPDIEVIDTYTYSYNRLVDHVQKINGAPAQRIASYTYNERGVLTKKGVGGLSTASTPQQAIDYRYNVRGWLTKINDVASLGTDLFAETINYNQPTSGTALYNGNISQVSWMTANDLQKRNYNYTYDALNRIKTGVFTNSNNASQNNSFNLNSITYDRNGNITFLRRNGTSAQTDLDKMTYFYNGNVLQRISEAGIQAAGFITTKAPGDATVQYTYDKNGNLLTDTNKKITSTTYNHLNLPLRVTFSDGKYLDYVYNSAGEKVKKTYYNGSLSTVTEYNLGFVYEKVGAATTELRYIPTEEGYAYKNADGITFNYAVQLKDHLNNVRVSFSETDGNTASISTAEIIEEANYDPFGLKHTGYNNSPTGNGVALAQKIEFNGREFEEVSAYNMNEMDWRHYDPATGRFVCIDKLQEAAYSMSPYVFSNNNPIIFVDPSGLMAASLARYDWDTGKYYNDRGEISFEDAVAANNIQFTEVNSAQASEIYSEIMVEFMARSANDTSAKSGSTSYTSDGDHQGGKKITKAAAGIKSGDTAEIMISKILKVMKKGDYIDGGDMSFLNSHIGLLISKGKLTSVGVLEIDRTMGGWAAGIGEDAKLTIVPAKLGKLDGFNYTISGVSDSIKNKMVTSGFINDNKVYFYENGKLYTREID